MNNKNQEYTFTAKIEEIPQIIRLVLEKAQNSGVPGKRLLHLELALEELLVNIVSYAYQTSAGEILVKIQDGETDFENRFTVSIIDSGVCFDPLSANLPNAEAKLEERPIGGLGIMLIRNIMDEVHYVRENDKNKMTFVVYKNRPDLPGRNL